MCELECFLPTHPNPAYLLSEDRYITYAGCNLLLSGPGLSSSFRVLEGHSYPITCMAVSNDRTLCATGQSAKESSTHTTVPVIVWDLRTLEPKLVLRGHGAAIKLMTFSEDASLLAVCDAVNPKITIWDISTETPAVNIPLKRLPSTMAFGGIGGQRWTMHYTVEYSLYCVDIVYNQAAGNYDYTTTTYANPTTGYKRLYTSSVSYFPHLIVGTPLGEISHYDTSTHLIRSYTPIDDLSIGAIAATDDPDTVLVGGAHLSIVKGFSDIQKVIKLEAPVVSISYYRGNALVRTEDCTLYLINLSSKRKELISRNLPGEPLSVAINQNGDTLAVALGKNGYAIVSRNKYGLYCQYIGDISAASVGILPRGNFVFGCTDGSLLCVDPCGNELWRTERIHRSTVTAVCATEKYIAAASVDGMIRIVSHQTRTIVSETLAHQSAITKLVPRPDTPDQLNSVGNDRSLAATKVSTMSRIMQQAVQGRVQMTSIIQFPDGENEIIASLGNGKLLGYDWPRPGVISEATQPDSYCINWIELLPGTRIICCVGESDYIWFYDYNSDSWTQSPRSHSLSLRSVLPAPNGRTIYTSADDGLAVHTML